MIIANLKLQDYSITKIKTTKTTLDAIKKQTNKQTNKLTNYQTDNQTKQTNKTTLQQQNRTSNIQKITLITVFQNAKREKFIKAYI